jgi:hypothetical protein
MNGAQGILRIDSLRRILLLVQAFVFFFLILGTALRVQGEAGGGAAAIETGAASAVPAQGALPAKWSEGVRMLAGKIAVAVKPARSISLELKNLSSVGAAEVEAIGKTLEAELQNRGVRVRSGETEVGVTLSENDEGYVWVGEIRRNGSQESAPRVAIVSVPRASAETRGEKKESLTLSRNLVWEQPNPMLDFAVFYKPVGITDSILVILEPDRLVYYRSANSEWHPWTTVAFTHSEPARRDPTGGISVADHTTWAPGVRCSGDIQEPGKVECALWKDGVAHRTQVGPKIRGHESDVGGVLGARCGSKSVALVSGDADWTQKDSIEGYLLTDFLAQGVPSGSPLEFGGPVVAARVDLLSGDDKEGLRVIVHNLKTGDYEGYIVTATCSQ